MEIVFETTQSAEIVFPIAQGVKGADGTDGFNFIKSNGDISLAKRKNDVLYGILDQYTGEQITLSKVTGTPTVDWIIYFQLGAEYFKRNYTEVNVKWFGAKGDGVTNDRAAFVAALAIADNIKLESGTYKISTRLTIPAGKNIYGNSKYSTVIYGRLNVSSNSKFSNLSFMVDNAFMSYDGNGLIENTAQTDNVIFDNCVFEIKNTTTVIDTLGVFTFNFGINNLKFSNCNFSVPSISMNGIKFVQDLTSNITCKNVTIDNCLFKDIGRIGIEIWSVVNGDNTVPSIENVTITNSIFENVGIIINDVSGIGISLSGYVFNCKAINNTFKNIKGIGFEIVRYHTGTIVSNNSFYKCNNGTISPISATLDEGAVGYITACNISDNTFTDCNGMYLLNINESVVKGNVFVNSTFGEIGGKNNFILNNQISKLKTGWTTPFVLNNLIKSNIKGNRIITTTTTLTQLFTMLGTCSQNIFSENDGMLLNGNLYVLGNSTSLINKFSDINTNWLLDNFRRTDTTLNLYGSAQELTWNLNTAVVAANSFIEYGGTLYTDYIITKKLFEVAAPCDLKGCIVSINETGVDSFKIRVTNPTSNNITLNGSTNLNPDPWSNLNWSWIIFVKYR